MALDIESQREINNGCTFSFGKDTAIVGFVGCAVS